MQQGDVHGVDRVVNCLNVHVDKYHGLSPFLLGSYEMSSMGTLSFSSWSAASNLPPLSVLCCAALAPH